MSTGFKKQTHAIAALLMIVTGISSVFASGSLQVGNELFDTLPQALASLSESGTITLLDDIELTDKVLFSDRAVTLDMNEHDIVLNGGAIEICCGSLDIIGTGSVCGTSQYGYAVNVRGLSELSDFDCSNLTIGENVSVRSDDGVGLMISENGGVAYGIEIEISGSVSGYSDGIRVSETIPYEKGLAPKISIFDGASVSGDIANGASGVNILGDAEFEFDWDCNISGTNAVSACTGTVMIWGGTFTGESDALMFNCADNIKEPYVEIYDGIFSSENGMSVVADITAFIYGGFFYDRPDPSYIVEGMGTAGYEGGYYIDFFSVEACNQFFCSLQEAVDAVDDGGDVTLISDITIMASVEIAGKSINLVLNGHIVSASPDCDGGDTVFIIRGGGKLSIDGTEGNALINGRLFIADDNSTAFYSPSGTKPVLVINGGSYINTLSDAPMIGSESGNIGSAISITGASVITSVGTKSVISDISGNFAVSDNGLTDLSDFDELKTDDGVATEFHNVSSSKLFTWASRAGEGKSSVSASEIKSVRHSYEAFLFNQKVDAFAVKEPKLHIERMASPISSNGKFEIALKVTAGDDAIDLEQINGTIAVKSATSLTGLSSAEDIEIGSDNVKIENGRVIISVTPPAGQSRFFKVIVR